MLSSVNLICGITKLRIRSRNEGDSLNKICAGTVDVVVDTNLRQRTPRLRDIVRAYSLRKSLLAKKRLAWRSRSIISCVYRTLFYIINIADHVKYCT